MPNVVRTDIDSVNAVLTVTLPKEEYLDKVKNDIKQYTQKATMKGFRPGKTPPTLVKKMYGSQFLLDAVNGKVQEAIEEYLKNEDIPILGQPIMSLEQEKFNLDLKNPQDLTFKFDVGLTPEFDVKGLDGTGYSYYVVQVDDEAVTAEINKMLEKKGESKEVEGQVQPSDVITLQIKEAGGSLEKEISVSVDWMTEDMQSVFLTQSKGDSLQINIFQLEKDTTPQYIRKYFLGLEDTDTREINEIFDATIVKIMRLQKPEMDEEFWQKTFGVPTEGEARAEIKKFMSKGYENQADALLLRDIQDKLLESNSFDLPHVFLKRWLKTQNEKNTDDIIESQFDRFAENMRWTLIRSKILKEANIQISENDLREYYAIKIKSMLGGMALPDSDNFINSLTDRALSDEKQFNELHEEVLTEKLFNLVKSKVILNEKPVSAAEFASITATATYEAAKLRGEIQEEAQVEEVEA